MENRIYLTDLYLIYQDLLTEVEKETFESYYLEDLSLTEIGENRHISKSSVSKTLKEVCAKLENYEKILQINTKKTKLQKLLLEDNIETLKQKLEKLI